VLQEHSGPLDCLQKLTHIATHTQNTSRPRKERRPTKYPFRAAILRRRREGSQICVLPPSSLSSTQISDAARRVRVGVRLARRGVPTARWFRGGARSGGPRRGGLLLRAGGCGCSSTMGPKYGCLGPAATSWLAAQEWRQQRETVPVKEQQGGACAAATAASRGQQRAGEGRGAHLDS